MRPSAVALMLAVSGALSGCGMQTLPDADPQAELSSLAWKMRVAELADAMIDWSSFRDPQLEALIDRSLTHNPDITTAIESLNLSRVELEEARAARGIVYSAVAAAGAGKIRDLPSTESYSLSGQASYEVDVWGRRRTDVELAEIDVNDAELSLLSTRISLAAEVADAYYSLRVFDERLKLQRESLQYALEQQRRIEARYRAGIVSGIAINNQEVLVQQLRAAIADLEGSRSLQEDRLAVLTGQPPQSFALSAAATLRLPFVQLAPNTPAEVLRRRPDIQQAEVRLKSSELRFEQAKRAFFPTVSLSGGTGLASTDLGDLLDDTSWSWNIGADLITTLLDNGVRSRNVERARIAAAQSLAAYRRSILAALQDVEGALNQQEVNLRRFEIQRLQLEAQARLTRETEERYRLGAVSGFELVRQQRNLIAQREQLLNTELAGIQASIQLLRAVGIAP